MEFLQSILENTQYSFLTAIILGLMTAISPCPLATNISAIGFLGRDIEDRRRVFIGGLLYTAGRAFSYTLIAVILYFGAEQMNVSAIFQGWGEKFLGPFLIIIGIFLLDLIKLNFSLTGKLGEKLESKAKKSYTGAFLLGVLFAMAFCPYSGVLYFGMLIPLTLSGSSGLLLPVLFAIATGIPVIIFSWLLAYAVSSVGKTYNKIKIFEKWFRKIIGILFIIIGIYYIFLTMF